jgi:hypothetical protein
VRCRKIIAGFGPGGTVAIESYSKEREMEAAGDNKREFERLVGETDNAPPGH